MLSVSLLGDVRADRGGQRLDLGSARRRSVFAALALRANQPVSRPELIADVWGEDPPATADGNLYTYVSDLRRVLEPQRSRWSGGQVLASTDAGYVLRIDPERLDVLRLDALRADAHRHLDAGEWARAWQSLTDALGLWRGEAVTGASGPFAERHRARLADLRLATREQRAGAALELGRPAEVIDELEPLVQANPRRESLCGLLMTALAMAGRTGEALAVYRRAERVLAEELGIDPAPALRRLAQRLRGDAPAATAGTVVGRAEPLARLRARVRALAAGRGGVVWVAGEPGIGKTSLVAVAFDGSDERGVLWGAGDELSSRFPLGLLLEAIDAVPFAVDPRRRALAAEARRAADSNAVAAVVDFVERLCDDGPLALVLDDLQWADGATLHAVRRLAASTARLPLLLVAAARPVPCRIEVDDARAAVLAAGGDVLELGPLNPGEEAELAVAAGVRLDASALAQAGGNPRYLHQVLDGSPVTAQQLTFLSAETRDLLRWAALLGDGFALGELAMVLARPPADLERGVAEAVTAGVLVADGERYEFRHALVRQACHDATPQAIRQAMRQQAARALTAKVS